MQQSKERRKEWRAIFPNCIKQFTTNCTLKTNFFKYNGFMHKQVYKQTNEINNRDVAQSVILWKNSHKTDSQWIAEAHWVMYWLMFLEHCSYSSLCPWSQSTLYLMKLRKNGLTGRQKSCMCHLMKMRLKAAWGFDVPRETRWHLRGRCDVAKLVMIHR